MNNLFSSRINDTYALSTMFVSALLLLMLCTPASKADQFASDGLMTNGGAETFDYDGTVTETTGFLGTLLPVGTGFDGTMRIAGTPNGMTTNPQDFVSALLKMRNAQGSTLFCFFYNNTCSPGETVLPIESIDAISLSFDAGGCPSGGSMQITAHSNTFNFDLVVSFDFNTSTFSVNVDALGALAGTGTIVSCDTDGDSVPDNADNCTLVANTDQRDSNNDGYGNACDPDLDNNNIVNFADISLWVPFFNTFNGGDQDFDGDGNVGFGDYARYPQYFQQPPGPSGVAP